MIVKVINEECEGCTYYDRTSGLCGFCMRRILNEVRAKNEKEGDKDGNRTSEIKGS